MALLGDREWESDGIWRQISEWGDHEVGNLKEGAVDGLNASHCPNSDSSSKTIIVTF